MDTTLRDGEQTQGVSFSPREKLAIAQALLSKVKVDRIEVASAGVSQGEQDAVKAINDWASQHNYQERVEVLGFVDGKRSVDWIKGANGKVINLLTKGSEKHCRMQLRQTLDEHIAGIKNTVQYAQDQDLMVNVYLEDWSNGYRDSRDYVYEITQSLIGQNIQHVMLPDTLGVLSPTEVSESVGDMVSRFPELKFDFHPHNDYGLATANVMAAVQAGVESIHCTVNCLGERAGNASLAEVAVVLKDKLDRDISINEQHIVDTSQLVASFSGKFVACNAPILGSDVFTQTAGIHADGDKKGNLYVTELTPERFARKRTYALGKMSGKASLANNLDELGISLTEDEQRKVLAKVIELGDKKQVISLSDLPFIISEVVESKNLKHIELIDCEISSKLADESTCSILVKLEGQEYKENGKGNGGYDAFIDALDKVLLSNSNVQRPKLVDYQVHIPKGGKTDSLTEASISWRLSNGRLMTTRGVNSNQVYAAIQATLKVINLVMDGSAN
jgi:D-citramalate synthase